MNEVITGLRNQALPSRSVAITFDDGYLDNLTNAKPLLERFHIPVTLFVATGEFVGGEFWWDDLTRLLLEPDDLPQTLNVTIDQRLYSWSLGDFASNRPDKNKQYFDWRGWLKPTTARHAVYLDLYNLLLRTSSNERRRILKDLAIWASASTAGLSDRLSRQDLFALAQTEYFDIGAHTVSHPILPSLSFTKQQTEIERSKSLLESQLARPVVSFAYPHGRFSSDTISIVRKAGFHCACTTVGQPVTHRCDFFTLPRFQVMDWDGDTFAKQLSYWLSTDSV